MGKRRGGSLPRQMPARPRPAPGSLKVRMVIPGLPIAAPDPLAVSLGGTETAGLQIAAELVRQGHQVTLICGASAPFVWRGVSLQGGLSKEEIAEPCDLFLVVRDARHLRHGATARAAKRRAARFLYSTSAPGEAPRKRTGTLQKSVAAEVHQEGDAVVIRVGSNVPYARFLEYGTRKMAARPWLRPSIAEAQSMLVRDFISQLRGSFGG